MSFQGLRQRKKPRRRICTGPSPNGPCRHQDVLDPVGNEKGHCLCLGVRLVERNGLTPVQIEQGLRPCEVIRAHLERGNSLPRVGVLVQPLPGEIVAGKIRPQCIRRRSLISDGLKKVRCARELRGDRVLVGSLPWPLRPERWRTGRPPRSRPARSTRRHCFRRKGFRRTTAGCCRLPAP